MATSRQIPMPKSRGLPPPSDLSEKSFFKVDEEEFGTMKKHHYLITALGLSPARSVWGSKPLDLGIKLSCIKREEWYVDTPHNDHGHHGHNPTWFNTKWYHIPRLRHLWGDAQYMVHAGAQELFLDLIFVGVAYQVGGVLKDAFYSCDPTGGSPSYGGYGGSSSNASGTSSGYSSGYGGAPQPACVGLSIGIVHALAPFISQCGDNTAETPTLTS